MLGLSSRLDEAVRRRREQWNTAHRCCTEQSISAAQRAAALALTRVSSLRQKPVPRSGPYRRRDLRRLTALTAVITAGPDGLQSNVPQRKSQYDLPVGTAGWFLAVLAAGSCAGGLIVSFRFRPLRSRGNYLRPAALSVGFAALNVPVVPAPNVVAYGLNLSLSTLAFIPLMGFTRRHRHFPRSSDRMISLPPTTQADASRLSWSVVTVTGEQ